MEDFVKKLTEIAERLEHVAHSFKPDPKAEKRDKRFRWFVYLSVGCLAAYAVTCEFRQSDARIRSNQAEIIRYLLGITTAPNREEQKRQQAEMYRFLKENNIPWN